MSPRSRQAIALLDVNVLVALAWPNHTHHGAARTWFTAHRAEGWATTPVTEAGLVRVSSNRAAIPTATTPHIACQLLRELTGTAGHQFWPDDVPLVVGDQSDSQVDSRLVSSYRDVTDAHLLALAIRRGGRLVTFDAGISDLLSTEHSTALQVLPAQSKAR